MLLKSEKLNYKYGEAVKFQIWNQVYNKKGLPNYRFIECHGHLASSVAMNGAVWCVMGEKRYRVKTENLLSKTDRSLVGTMNPPAGFTLEPVQYIQSIPGVEYYGGGTSGGKIPVSQEDRDRYRLNPSNTELDEAIQKQKDLINGKAIG